MRYSEKVEDDAESRPRYNSSISCLKTWQGIGKPDSQYKNARTLFPITLRKYGKSYRLIYKFLNYRSQTLKQNLIFAYFPHNLAN